MTTVCLRNLKRIPNARYFSSAQHAAPLLLTPHGLRDLSKTRKISVLDASWFMPNSPRKAFEEHAVQRIPDAQFLDLDEVASQHPLDLKHMMPTEHLFAETCEKFGIEPSSHVVLYDTTGIFSSPRALFMFRSFGHHKSSVLDGGLPAWKAQGLPVQTGPLASASRAHYPTPKLNTGSLRSYEQIVSNSLLNPDENPHAELVLDARSSGRFLGTEPEPRPGLSSGHIPHSVSLPFSMFLQKQMGLDGTEYTTFSPRKDIQKALEEAVGADRSRQIINGRMRVTTSCGSGMTAGILWLGLELLGVKDVSLYDESWSGYAMRDSSKIEKDV